MQSLQQMSEAMADAVLRIYDNKDLAAQFKENNKEMVQKYSEQSVIDEMLKIYKDLRLI